jgi:hypothetical protein
MYRWMLLTYQRRFSKVDAIRDKSFFYCTFSMIQWNFEEHLRETRDVKSSKRMELLLICCPFYLSLFDQCSPYGIEDDEDVDYEMRK